MEHSYYQEKAIYFKNTRHGGGKVKSNAMHEMFDWFYRVSARRERRKTRVKNALRCKITKVINVRGDQKRIMHLVQKNNFGSGLQ